VLAQLESGALSAGHGRALLAARDPEALAQLVREKNLSVRETERLAQADDAEPRPKPSRKREKSADVMALEKELTNQLGMKVEVSDQRDERGHVTVHYRSLEQLELICGKLRG
jgi:ParB family chromosome partitioning protein